MALRTDGFHIEKKTLQIEGYENSLLLAVSWYHSTCISADWQVTSTGY